VIYLERIPTQEQNAFAEKVQDIADRFGFRADWLMIVMYFETGGTFRTGPHGNGATGLIGFRATTAQELGVTLNQLSSMSRVQQLTYVEMYLGRWKAERVRNLTQLYMIVFNPANAFKPSDTILYKSPQAGYTANAAAFDPAKKGYFTIADVGSVIARYAQGVPTGTGLNIAFIIVAIILLYFITKSK
jgi:hypothetical protein